MIFHGCGKLKAMTIFPSVFRGEHSKHRKQVSVLEGKEITVELDHPAPLQIDGDAVLEAVSYAVSVQPEA